MQEEQQRQESNETPVDRGHELWIAGKVFHNSRRQCDGCYGLHIFSNQEQGSLRTIIIAEISVLLGLLLFKPPAERFKRRPCLPKKSAWEIWQSSILLLSTRLSGSSLGVCLGVLLFLSVRALLVASLFAWFLKRFLGLKNCPQSLHKSWKRRSRVSCLCATREDPAIITT